MAGSDVYYIRLGAGIANLGAIKYGFRAPKDAYKGIERELGVVKAKEKEPGLVMGANSPRPARVRINYEGGGATVRFCDPGKLESVVVGGSLNRKTVNIAKRFRNKKISTVTVVAG